MLELGQWRRNQDLPCSRPVVAGGGQWLQGQGLVIAGRKLWAILSNNETGQMKDTNYRAQLLGRGELGPWQVLPQDQSLFYSDSTVVLNRRDGTAMGHRSGVPEFGSGFGSNPGPGYWQTDGNGNWTYLGRASSSVNPKMGSRERLMVVGISTGLCSIYRAPFGDQALTTSATLLPFGWPSGWGSTQPYHIDQDRMIIYGGKVSGVAVMDIWEVNMKTFIARKVGLMPEGFNTIPPSLSFYRGYAIMTGGDAFSMSFSDKIWACRWNQQDGQQAGPWVQIGTLPATRARHAQVVDEEGYLHIFGGLQSDFVTLITTSYSVKLEA